MERAASAPQSAKALKKAGYKVAANYGGNDDAAKAFKKDTKIPVYQWDVGDYVACEQGIINVENEVGPIEVLVNNAGISRDAMLQKMTHEQWEQVIRTNLNSLFNMTRPVINGMRERGFGRVVNISSINGQKGQLGLANYCSAKAGVIGFTRALALESARKGITVNAIAPGYVEHRSAVGRVRGGDEVDRRADPGRPLGRGRRGRPLRGVPRRRRGRLDHRLDAHHQRRPIHGLSWRSPKPIGFSTRPAYPVFPVIRCDSEGSRPPWLEALGGQLEAGEVEARRHGAADQRPRAQAARALPRAGRHQPLRMLARHQIRAEPILVTRPVFA